MISEAILSPAFVDFLAHWLDGDGYGLQAWPDQQSEELQSNWHLKASADIRLQRMQLDERTTAIFDRLRGLQEELWRGNLSALRKELRKFKFVCIVGAPRSGGSYLTSELFTALGQDPYATPALIAHDGFPSFRPFTFRKGNAFTLAMCQAAEFAIAVELFYRQASATETQQLVVPKKLTKAAYAGEFVREYFGEDATYFVTIRNPLSSCISTFEKSGGLPEDESFTVRSAIEKWIQRDVEAVQFKNEHQQLNYFQAYFKYWELYYVRLAMSGLLHSHNSSVVAYSAKNMERVANAWHAEYGSNGCAGEFYEAARSDIRFPRMRESAIESIQKVAGVWTMLGLKFPVDELLEFH
jgi:hypothetical protein